MRFAVPYSKPDISLPADIVEEIMRIDGLDNVEIPSMITIAPATETLAQPVCLRRKVSITWPAQASGRYSRIDQQQRFYNDAGVAANREDDQQPERRTE